MNGILQYVQPNGVLAPVTQATLVAQITECAGSETANGEHILEAYLETVTKLVQESNMSESDLAYYYYWNNDAAVVAVIAGPSGMDSGSQIQPMYAQTNLVLNPDGSVMKAGECYVTSAAFPRASPFSPQFSFR